MNLSDIRTLEHVPGKSINLAMSVRGLSGLDKIGLGSHVAKEYGIPMRARMIHNLDRTTYPGKKHFSDLTEANVQKIDLTFV